MNVIFENTTIVFDNHIAEVLIGFVNHILMAHNEDTLRRLVADYAERTDFDRYFVYGYGRNHFWLVQKKVTDPEKTFDYRILIVEF